MSPSKFLFFFAFITCFIAVDTFGQCTESLESSQRKFYQGNFSDIPDLITGCMSTFDREEKLRAYELLVNTYLERKDYGLAENSMLSLLRINPNFKIDESRHSSEFILLYEQFDSDPVMNFRLIAGVNRSQIDVINRFGTDNTAERGENTKEHIGFQVGVGIDIPIRSNLELFAEIFFKQSRFDNLADLNTSVQLIAGGTSANFMSLAVSERLNHFEIPLGVKLTLPSKKLSPYILGGIMADINFYSQADFNLQRISPLDGNSKQVIEGLGVRLHDIFESDNMRETFTFAAVVGAGVKFQMLDANWSLDVRYKKGLQNIVNSENRFRYAFRFAYVDNDFTVDDFSLNISWIKSSYSPKIRKSQASKF